MAVRSIRIFNTRGTSMRRLIGMVMCAVALAGCASNTPASTGQQGATADAAAAGTQQPVLQGGIATGETATADAPAAAATTGGGAETATAATGGAAATTATASGAAAGATEAAGQTTTAGAATQAPAAGGAAAGGAAAQGNATAQPAAPGQTLQTVRSRGNLICGVHGSFAGFGTVDPSGNFVGFDVDFCKAVAAAVFKDPSKVQYRPLSAQERFTAVQTREVDMLSRNTTWTTARDTSVGMDFAPVTFYDGQGIMVRKSENISKLEDMGGASVCVQSGTTTELNLADNFRARKLEFKAVVFEEQAQAVAAYNEGRCDAITSDKSQLASNRQELKDPAEHVILDVTMSKEPLAPAVLQGDPQWKDIVTWVIYGVFTAEELGITSQNVDTFANSEDPNVRRLLGIEGDLGKGLGLENNFMVNVIKAVGNYGEIYNRHLGPGTPFNLPRAQNDLYTKGGLIYAPPFR
jgi:general L-amino acid transport system substrate-binding protein